MNEKKQFLKKLCFVMFFLSFSLLFTPYGQQPPEARNVPGVYGQSEATEATEATEAGETDMEFDIELYIETEKSIETFDWEEVESEASSKEKEVVEIPPEMIVYLTLDDGPNAFTAEILDILQSYEVTATFFLLEPRIHQYPEMVQRMRDEGHALGSHGVSHDVKLFYQSMEQMTGEMAATAQAIQEVSGVETRLIRVPYGSSPHMTKEEKALMAEAGYILWDWNVDSKDWKYRDERFVESTIEQLERLRERHLSPVILVHDLKTTAQHLPTLLSYLVENGYHFRAIDSHTPAVQFN